MQWLLFCVLSAASATLGGTLMRKAALSGPILPDQWLPPHITQGMMLLGGALLAYGLSFIGYFLAVRLASLRLAYPVMVAFTCIGLYSVSVVYFGEPRRLLDVAGILLVLAGVAILARAV